MSILIINNIDYAIWRCGCRSVWAHDNILRVTCRSGYRWLASWRWVWLSWSPSGCRQPWALSTGLSRVFSLSSCSVSSNQNGRFLTFVIVVVVMLLLLLLLLFLLLLSSSPLSSSSSFSSSSSSSSSCCCYRCYCCRRLCRFCCE